MIPPQRTTSVPVPPGSMFPPHGPSRLSRSLKRDANNDWEAAAGPEEHRRSASGGLPYLFGGAPASASNPIFCKLPQRRQNSSGGSGGGKRHQNQRLSRSQDFGSVVAVDSGDGVVEGRPAAHSFMPGIPMGGFAPPPHPSYMQRRPSSR